MDGRPTGAGDTCRLIVAGNASADLILGPVTPWPTVGTEVLVDHSSWRIGGALGNTALALSGMHVPVHLVWDVGDDAMGVWLRDAIGAKGEPPRILPAPTSVTVALTHPDGERTFLSHLGHLAVSRPDALLQVIDGAKAGDILFVGGTFLLPRWQAGLPDLLARARSRGLRTALDTGWPPQGWSAETRRATASALAHVDVFLPNLEEARGLLDRADADATTVLCELGALTAGRVGLKLGRDGAAYLDADRPTIVGAPSVVVADTVGAGDTFNAIVLAAMRDGHAWAPAIALAVKGASFAVATSPRHYLPWSELVASLAASTA